MPENKKIKILTINDQIKGGNFTVFRGDIKGAMDNLKKKLEKDLEVIKTWESQEGLTLSEKTF